LFKRIIILTPSTNGMDGISAVSRSILKALATDRSIRDREIECWSLLDNGASADQGGTGLVRHRGACGGKLTLAGWSLRTVMADCRETLVLAIHLNLAPLALPLMARGACLAVFLHGIEAWQGLEGLRKSAVSRAWQVIGNSHYTISKFRAMNPGCGGSTARVCQLGISTHSPEPAPYAAPFGPFALVVGRMVAAERYKGHDLLIDIWPKVVSEFPTSCLVVAGDGDDRQRLESKASRRGLSERVKFLGKVSNEVLAALYRDCAFFVMPSSNEGFGLVFLEAMRAAKACVGGPGAASEVICDGRTGTIVDPTDPEQILRVLLSLFRSPELRERMGRAGAARFRSYFTDEHFRERLCRSLAFESRSQELSIVNGAA